MSKPDNNINATKHSALQARIQYNAAQSLDFIDWIFDGIAIPEGANIVEFCCGTGKQTMAFAERMPSSAKIYAFDIEEESVEFIRKNIDQSKKEQVICNAVDFNDIEKVAGTIPESIDIFFCSYGLYYNNDVVAFLELIKGRLSGDGQIIVVGPYGRNNEELFSFLEQYGVVISDYVRFTSQTFMGDVVLEWMVDNFKNTSIVTEKNAVSWDSWEKVFKYWCNSTFYNKDLEAKIEEECKALFEVNPTFINHKYIMKAVCNNAF